MIRDWGCPYEYPYGEDGGKNYVTKILKVGNVNENKLRYLTFSDVIPYAVELFSFVGSMLLAAKIFLVHGDVISSVANSG